MSSKPKFKLLPSEGPFLRWRCVRGHVFLPQTHAYVGAGHEVTCHRDVFWHYPLSWPLS